MTDARLAAMVADLAPLFDDPAAGPEGQQLARAAVMALEALRRHRRAVEAPAPAPTHPEPVEA